MKKGPSLQYLVQKQLDIHMQNKQTKTYQQAKNNPNDYGLIK